MNSIKNYLALILLVAFCAPFQMFTMEKEIPNTSGEDIDTIGYTSNMSNESGTKGPQELLEEERIGKQNTRDQLAKQVLSLETIAATVEKTLKKPTISILDIENLKQLRKNIHGVTKAAINMYNGIMPADTQGIDEDINRIRETYNNIAEDL